MQERIAVEKICVENSSVTYLFNQEEAEDWGQYGKVKCLPHGVNEALFQYQKHDPAWKDSVVFIGKMDYQPNIDAVVWYMENVHSVIGNQIPLVIVGAYPTDKVLEGMALRKSNVVSSLAAKPIVGAESGVHFLVADTLKEYVNVLLEIAADRGAYEQIGKEAQKLIKGRFTWGNYGREYLDGLGV